MLGNLFNNKKKTKKTTTNNTPPQNQSTPPGNEISCTHQSKCQELHSNLLFMAVNVDLTVGNTRFTGSANVSPIKLSLQPALRAAESDKK